MTFRARSELNPEGFMRRLDLRVMVADPDHREIMLWPATPTIWSIPADTDPAVEVEYPEGLSPWLELSEAAARALYADLAERFGGTAGDTRLLRADYVAERARVDKLTDALIAGFTERRS